VPEWLKAQLQATLNMVLASTWYAAPSGALRSVNERSADSVTFSETEPQFGRLSFFKNVANRGSLCKLFSRGFTFVEIRPELRWA